MKLVFNRRIQTSAIGEHGFTLVEMMTATGLFTLVITALIYAHMFGLRQDQLVESKLGASDQSRKSFDLLARDIRSAKIWQVGNGNATVFSGITSNSLQRGNALTLHLSMNTNIFVRYYFDTTDASNNRLCRSRSGATASVIASNLIGSMMFSALTPYGTNQTDLSHKGVIHTALEFCQYQYPKTMVGTNGNYLYDRYKLEFKYTPHVPDGP